MAAKRIFLRCMMATAVAAVAAVAQAQTPERDVKRPDGSVVYPSPASATDGRKDSRSPDSKARDADLERRAREAKEARERRLEQSKREREAAYSSPSRRVAPTQDR